jgi:hypothetical protein
MKKFLVMVAAAMMAAVSVNAQSAGSMFVKPMVGGTLSTFTGDVDNNKMKLGLVAGAEFGYFVADPFAVTAGALVSMQGSGFKDTDYSKDKSSTFTYLNIPILANYYIIPGLAVKAGIQPGFLLAVKKKWSDYYNNAWHDEDSTDKDGTKSFDLSIPLGLSYEFSDFVVDARYNLGVANISDVDHVSVKNSVIMLTVGYKIPF